jgi:lipoxygenase
MEMSSYAYDNLWRLDQEGLPADLIRRGMAVEDASQPHGLRLLIEDYPYATDGLLLWSAISRWCEAYVAAYFQSDEAVRADYELQSWYTEAVQSGHPDKRDAPWWPRLSTPADLASLLTTLVWLCSAQHAALNFGQYPLGGYIPNRPPLMRRLVPTEGDAEYDHLVADPHRFYLSALPGLTQTTTFMTVIDTLSTHSADEEYLGERPDGWTADPVALAARASSLPRCAALRRRSRGATLTPPAATAVAPACSRTSSWRRPPGRASPPEVSPTASPSSSSH